MNSGGFVLHRLFSEFVRSCLLYHYCTTTALNFMFLHEVSFCAKTKKITAYQLLCSIVEEY